jgi:ubiquinone/menaquinone biosynthesis C-methylase UbiE
MKATPPADERRYIHGYDPQEQERLVAQAGYWRHTLILPGLSVRPGERLLEVGCGAGAVLGVIGAAFPELRLAGIDLSPEQIDFARKHLARLGHPQADLRQGDATALPWPEATFDHVFMMWFLEHVPDPRPLIAQARRVLRPGGQLTVTETDYSMFHAFPSHPDLEYLGAAQRELFSRNGQADMGRRLGPLLAASGFQEVRSGPVGFHHFTGSVDGGLRAFVDYLLGFLDPMVPRLAGELGLDAARLQSGADFMRSLPDRPEASFTQIVFRARARRPSQTR